MQLPDNLICLFSARVERRDGSFVIEVPEREVRTGSLEEGGHYRFAAFPRVAAGGGGGRGRPRREPPVEVGDVREVTIEGLGDQGDGIARVDRGYVVIVPETAVGDEVAVEIESLHDNFAIGRVVEDEGAADEPDAETEPDPDTEMASETDADAEPDQEAGAEPEPE